MTPSEAREGHLSIVESLRAIDDRFENIRRVGSAGGGGNFSLMFTAADNRTGARVAIKIFNPMQRSNSYRLESFHREIEVLQSLRGQPDIMQLITPGSTFTEILHSDTGIPLPVDFSYYGMELAERSAKDRLVDGRWTALERLECFRALCRAVQRLHAAEFTHRDLKPDNVLQMQGGSWALSDFGTARSIGEGARSLLPAYGVFVPGDKRYWSPEMMAGLHDEDSSIAKRADIFALGAVLFELFAGTPLGTQIYDAEFIEDLMTVMAPIPLSKRRAIFHEVVREIVDARPLPTVAAYAADVPGSIRPYVDELYKAMASLDYRARPTSFQSIFRKIDICIRVLTNETTYRHYFELRRRRRLARRTT